MSLKLIFIIILSVTSLILFFVFSSIFRRISNTKKYRKLDRHREFYRGKIVGAMHRGDIRQPAVNFLFRSSPESIKWQAIEDILLILIAENKYKDPAKEFFKELGYVSFYEKKLKSKSLIKKAGAIDKLGKMLSESSVKLLLEILKNDRMNPEILAITVRSLSRIGAAEGLHGLLEELSDILGKSLVSGKTVESSLINFGLPAVPELTKHGRKNGDPHVKACILEALSGLPITELSCSFALENLNHPEPEVRAKALMILGLANEFALKFDPDLLLPLLNDDVWFVRLQAVKAFGTSNHEKAPDILGNLLGDKNWQVRNAASRVLAGLEDASLDVFLKILKSEDRYARESVCEEIERTDLARRLIENLDSPDQKIRGKSKEILSLMHALNFSTPIQEYLKKGTRRLKEEIGDLFNEAKTA